MGALEWVWAKIYPFSPAFLAPPADRGVWNLFSVPWAPLPELCSHPPLIVPALHICPAGIGVTGPAASLGFVTALGGSHKPDWTCSAQVCSLPTRCSYFLGMGNAFSLLLEGKEASHGVAYSFSTQAGMCDLGTSPATTTGESCTVSQALLLAPTTNSLGAQEKIDNSKAERVTCAAVFSFHHFSFPVVLSSLSPEKSISFCVVCPAEALSALGVLHGTGFEFTFIACEFTFWSEFTNLCPYSTKTNHMKWCLSQQLDTSNSSCVFSCQTPENWEVCRCWNCHACPNARAGVQGIPAMHGLFTEQHP